MSSPETAAMKPWYDISTREDRRRVLRTLILAVVALTVLAAVSDLFWPLPDVLEHAVNQEWEAMPQRKFWIGMLIGTGVLGLGLIGLWQLWNFRSQGTFFVAMYTFFPPFLVLPIAYVSPPAAGFFGALADVATGMLLFLCWTQPDVFEPEAADATPPTSGASPTPSAGG